MEKSRPATNFEFKTVHKGEHNEDSSDLALIPMEYKVELADLYAQNGDFFDNLASENLQTRLHQGNKFQYGNKFKFKSFEDRWKNPKIRMLKKEWFEGKGCLDIGCHQGDLTLMMTILYKP